VNALVIFGAPGSGKGTQAKMLQQCLGIPHVSTGEVLRQRIRAGAEQGSEVAATMKSGRLVSDEVVNGIVEERLSEPDAAKGFILDGYPRTRAQAEHIRQWFEGRGIREVVIYLVVDYNVIITRLAGRRQCPVCGTLYNMVSQPPKVDELCDVEGEKLMARDDDRPAVVRERLEEYERQTRPVLEFFRYAGQKVLDVEADEKPPEQIYRMICQALETHDRTEDRR
jgi:adenylate kinase